jgi:hypothetical protein
VIAREEESSLQPSPKELHIMEEYEKLLNAKTNEKQQSVAQLSQLSKIMLKVSFTISRILFQFGNEDSSMLSDSLSFEEALQFISVKLEKCLTFLHSENVNGVKDKLAQVDNDLNDSIVISKDDKEPPEWLRLKISKYKSQETMEFL